MQYLTNYYIKQQLSIVSYYCKVYVDVKNLNLIFIEWETNI